jgi:hypothetical protein
MPFCCHFAVLALMRYGVGTGRLAAVPVVTMLWRLDCPMRFLSLFFNKKTYF